LVLAAEPALPVLAPIPAEGEGAGPDGYMVWDPARGESTALPRSDEVSEYTLRGVLAPATELLGPALDPRMGGFSPINGGTCGDDSGWEEGD